MIQVVDHPYQFRTMAETIGLWNKETLSRQCIATQGHYVLNAKKMKVEQFTLNLAAGCTAADDMWHDFQLRETAHDGSNDGKGAWPFCQCHLSVCTIVVWHIFNFVAMTGNVDEWWRKFH